MPISTPRAHGIFLQGDTVSFSVDAGASAYTITDIRGNVVSSGDVTGTDLTPTPPTDGWANGWYMLALTTTAVNRGCFSFVVVTADARFPTPLGWGESEGPSVSHEELQTYTKEVARMGAHRLEPTYASTTSGGIAWAKTVLDIQDTTPKDAARPVSVVIAFSQGSAATGDTGTMNVYRYSTVPANDLIVAVVAGTTKGTFALTVTDAATSTQLEIFDNCYTREQMGLKVTAGSAHITCAPSSSDPIHLYAIPTLGSATLPATPGATTRSIVQALFGYKGTTWFEGPVNEPDKRTHDLVAYALAFHKLVHAASSTAKVLVPDLLDAISKMPGFVDTCKKYGFTPDGVSFHPYNNTGLELAANDLAYAAVINPVRAAWPGIPILCTEWGFFAGQNRLLQPFYTAATMTNVLIHSETWGIPKENFVYDYDGSHGFGGYPSWWANGDGSLTPHWSAARGISERVYGRTLDTRLPVPAPYNRWVLAARWKDASSQLVFVQSCGMKTVTAKLVTTGTTRVYDLFGNVIDTPAAGTISITADQLGVWVEAATVTLSSVEGVSVDLVNLADARYTNAVITVDTADPGAAARANVLVGYPDPLQGDRTGVGGTTWMDSTRTLPLTVTATFPTAKKITRSALAFARPSTDVQRNGPIRVVVEVLVGGAWVQVDSFDNPNELRNLPLAYIGSDTWYEKITFWDHAHVVHSRFTPTLCTAIRWRILDTSVGFFDTLANGKALQNATWGGSTVTSAGADLQYLGVYA